ncbi:extracellular solute-binding protein [Paenibacillus paridis]|uniref:extracellular solute-binding protein n=1 Tax=Paenibacillus paridis TaxID=2583376 RepID=UPI001120F1BD|nr:extracellular solute-binding protein [Paenibacillus paridis]
MQSLKRITIMCLMAALFVTVFAACSSNGNNKSTNAPTNAGGTEASAEPTDAPVKDLGIVKVVNMGDKPVIDLDKEYYPILDELTAQWGIKLRVEYVPWGQEMTTLQTRIAAGDIDLITIGPWSNYATLAASNAFYDLNKVIDQAPKLAEKFGGADGLKKLEIAGKLNYIPQFSGKTNVTTNGFLYRVDLAEQWGVKPVTDLESLNAYLYKAKEELKKPIIQGTPDSSGIAGRALGMYMDVTGDATAGISAIASKQSDPFNSVFLFEQPEYLEALKQAKQWYDDGISDPDILNSKADPGIMMQDGLLPAHFLNHFSAAKVNIIPPAMNKLNGGEADADAANPKGIKFGFLPYVTSTGKLLTANMGNTTGVAIGVNTSDEKAAAIIKFIEAVHTDKEFFDKFQYGKEGVSYVSFPTDATVDFGTIPAEKKMYRKMSTGFTNNDMARTEQIRYKDLAADLTTMQNNLDSLAVDNPLNGFIFNPEKIQNQLLAVNDVLAATSATRSGITGGKSIEDALADMNKKLKAAGLDAIIDEMNTQLQVFKEKVGA